MAYIYNMVDTWNASGTTYTGIGLNVTDTASDAASLLMDLQVGGSSKFSVSKAGAATFGGSITVTAASSYVNAAGLSLGTSGAGGIFVSGGNAFVVNSSGGFRWSSNANVNIDTAGDLILTRRAAANLRFGAADAAAPVAQTLSVQSVVTGTSNTAGANLTITGSQGTGTGAGGSIIFQTAPAGLTGNTPNALATALTIDSASIATFAGTLRLPDGSSTVASLGFNNGGFYNLGFYKAGTNAIGLATSSGNYLRFTDTNPLFLRSDKEVAWASTTSFGAADLFLLRDAANTLALRNGAAAQRFNVYNTYTSSTNYEAFKIDWITTTNTVLVGTEKGSVAGTARALELQTDGATRLTIPSNGGVWTTSGQFFHFRASANTSASIISPSDGVMTLGNWNADNFNRLQFGGTSALFPALKRNGAGIDVVGADGTNVSFIRVPGVAVASLPSAATAGVGALSFVTDATTTMTLGIGTVVAGGGANKVPVYSDGTNWLIG